MFRWYIKNKSMAHIIKLTSKITNNDILVNLDQINVIFDENDGVGSRICFKKSKIDQIVTESVKEVYNIINNKGILKG